MPIYEYSCQSCSNEFERIVPSSKPDDEINCPKCGKNNSKRKLSLFSFGSRSASGDFKQAPSSGASCATCSASTCSGCRL